MSLEPGQAATVEPVVTRELTADALGDPGVTVLATLVELERWAEIRRARRSSPEERP
jgi:hypothetical protein